MLLFFFNQKKDLGKNTNLETNFKSIEFHIARGGSSRGENTCRSGVVLLERGRFDTLGKPSLVSYIHFEFLGITLRD